MLAQERHDEIVRLVNENGSVLVKDLAKRFSVTEDSIRKDLTALEKQGLLKKTYGGAMRIRVNEHEIAVSKRKGKNLPQKREIARKAAMFIRDGDMIFLDNSTCNLELARILIEQKKPVTIVTGMIDILLLFQQPCEPRLIFVGGELNRERDAFNGTMANQLIDRFNFDLAFMGVVSVDLERDRVTTYEADDGITKELAMRNASQSYLMLEKRKFDAEGNYSFATLEDFTGAVLDVEPGSTHPEKDKYGIRWI